MKSILIIALSILAFGAPALAQTETPTALCALHEPDAPRPRGHGTILWIQDPAVARANIPLREAQRGGAIDPRYLDDVRARVRRDDGTTDTFDVLSGMTVRAGDRVRIQGSYRSTAAACSYIPQMVVPSEVPVG